MIAEIVEDWKRCELRLIDGFIIGVFAVIVAAFVVVAI